VLVSTHTYPAAIARIVQARSLVVDLETDGLRPYLGNRLIGVAVAADGHPADYFSFRHAADNLPGLLLRDLLSYICSFDLPEDSPRELGGHNFIRFDCPMVAMEGGLFAEALLANDRIPKWDTIVDAMLANENEPSFSLDALGQKYLGQDAALKHERKAALLALLKVRNPKVKAQRQLMGLLATLTGAEVADYACGDVEDTRALRAIYRPHHAAWGLEALSWDMYAYARLLARIERTGLLIDTREAAARVARCTAEQDEVAQEIRLALHNPGFNPNSPPQVCALLGTKDARAKTVKRSGHPLAAQIIRYKRLGKVRGTYYENMVKNADFQGVIHPQMNLTRDPTDAGGTRSGRLSCSNPNFQNLPKRSPEWYMRVRELVLARPGRSIVLCDYERAEMWLAGHYSGDESLTEAYTAGRDLYVELAEKTGTDRQGAKIDWLAIQYGARGRKLSEMHDWPFIPVAQLEKDFGRPCEAWTNAEWSRYMTQRGPSVVTGFFDLCPGIKATMQELEERATEDGSFRMWSGRVIHFDGTLTPPFVAWNRLIQGGVGEMTRVAMQRLEPLLDSLDARMLLQVHDEIVVECPDERVSEVIATMRKAMCDFDFALRPRVEPKVGKTYGTVEDVG